MVKRFIHIDKLSTAHGTERNVDRPYRFGYGILDRNLNGIKDEGEREVYFEFSDYSTSYVFYDSDGGGVEVEIERVILLTNQMARPVAYKVKTTSPEDYRVRPSCGIVLPSGCEVRS